MGDAGGVRQLAAAAPGGGSAGSGIEGARRALLFAEHGFAVEAIDGVGAGLNFARPEASAHGLQLSLRQADADALPFADECFDYVLSWNVMFHGTMGEDGFVSLVGTGRDDGSFGKGEASLSSAVAEAPGSARSKTQLPRIEVGERPTADPRPAS